MNDKVDTDYWVNAYQRILGVRPETFYRSFNTDLIEGKIINLIKQYPNDEELGYHIRNLYFPIKKDDE